MQKNWDQWADAPESERSSMLRDEGNSAVDCSEFDSQQNSVILQKDADDL